MKPPDDPFVQSPIATPDGQVAPPPPTPSIDRNNWSTAPQIVRTARILNAILAVVYVITIFVSFLRSPHSPNSSEEFGRITGSILMALFVVGLMSWLAQEFRKANPKAWSGQIAVSVLGLLNCPIGTLINAYILSQWFKPEVKLWFDKS